MENEIRQRFAKKASQELNCCEILPGSGIPDKFLNPVHEFLTNSSTPGSGIFADKGDPKRAHASPRHCHAERNINNHFLVWVQVFAVNDVNDNSTTEWVGKIQRSSDARTPAAKFAEHPKLTKSKNKGSEGGIIVSNDVIPLHRV